MEGLTLRMEGREHRLARGEVLSSVGLGVPLNLPQCQDPDLTGADLRVAVTLAGLRGSSI